MSLLKKCKVTVKEFLSISLPRPQTFYPQKNWYNPGNIGQILALFISDTKINFVNFNS